MKKVFAIFAVAAFVACNNSSESSEAKADSTAAAPQTVVADSAAAKVDSATAAPKTDSAAAKADTTKKK